MTSLMTSSSPRRPIGYVEDTARSFMTNENGERTIAKDGERVFFFSVFSFPKNNAAQKPKKKGKLHREEVVHCG